MLRLGLGTRYFAEMRKPTSQYSSHIADLIDKGTSVDLDLHGSDSPSPTLVVERFIELLCAKDIDGATDLLAADVEYANVGLKTLHGRERVRRVLRATLGSARVGFEVYMHTVAANGSSVLIERTDVLTLRRLRVQFWVCGRFDVNDGEIVLWRDYFDYVNFNVAMLRGMVGIVVPAARAKPPAV
jgi:limonene-1,2-epoxide hydrolase